MIEPYQYPHTIEPGEIDAQGHANNVAYVAWMQRAALAHTAALGWPTERYLKFGGGWVARSHRITYHTPALVGQQIVVETWVAAMRKATSTRKYRIVRRGDGQLLADAETLWAFVDYQSGRPARIPPAIADAFAVREQRFA